MPDEYNEGPRGVAAPSDPHGEETDGVGRDGHYAGEGGDIRTCEECGGPVNRHGELCKSCHIRENGRAGSGERATRNGNRETSWTFDRLGFAVVTASIENLAIAYGKAALKNREDRPTVPVDADSKDTFDCLDDIDGEPNEVLQGEWPPLKAAIRLDSEHGEQILVAALDELASAEAPVFYDESGSPISEPKAIEYIRSNVGTNEYVWLVPGFLYDLEVPDRGSDRTSQVIKSKLKCVNHEERTLHIFEGQQNRMSWWSCQECDEVRPGPSPKMD